MSLGHLGARATIGAEHIRPQFVRRHPGKARDGRDAARWNARPREHCCSVKPERLGDPSAEAVLGGNPSDCGVCLALLVAGRAHGPYD